jgi:hypothetical protein
MSSTMHESHQCILSCIRIVSLGCVKIIFLYKNMFKIIHLLFKGENNQNVKKAS